MKFRQVIPIEYPLLISSILVLLRSVVAEDSDFLGLSILLWPIGVGILAGWECR